MAATGPMGWGASVPFLPPTSGTANVTSQAAKAACIRFSLHLAAKGCPQHKPSHQKYQYFIITISKLLNLNTVVIW